MTWDKDYSDKKLSTTLCKVAIIAFFLLYKFRIMVAIGLIVVLSCFCTWVYGGERCSVVESDGQCEGDSIKTVWATSFSGNIPLYRCKNHVMRDDELQEAIESLKHRIEALEGIKQCTIDFSNLIYREMPFTQFPDPVFRWSGTLEAGDELVEDIDDD